jgi:acyl transferase domain-containing protein/NADPH:quinone reductase-like Zn-dependent oxidoreductase/SAM-dependent methyltransferase/acyl carrier protein
MSGDPRTPGEGGVLTPLKRAFLALEEAQARLAAAEGAAREPIAVIGAGCRLPGADGPAALWEVLRDGRDTTGPIPADRFDVDAWYDADPAVPGKIATRRGGFLGDVAGFDAGLFQIAPREAQGMDPQQRLLLEVAWEALEHAGLAPDALEGSPTGVYVGVASSDYAYLQLQACDRELFDAHYTSGVAHSVVSGRLSYLLGLAGPSVTVDTACSSSLVAVHQACLALRAGDCRLALAGGVNVILSPDLFAALSRSRMLAPDGRCKAFDAGADGFARGEGCGVVVLKRLADAVADGDRVLAVIRGSAVNQDGASSSLTAPNGPAQEAVVREALRRAGVAPGEVGLVEAHGTGTQLGDPIEAQALGAVFGPGRDPARPLWLGSVKTNLGHLEAAAGVTGLLKLVLALQHRQIPPHLHLRTPSPHIPWADLPLAIPTALTPWEPIGGRRIAGVSAFGFSGTNAHIVLEEAPASSSHAEAPPAPASPPADRAHLFLVSAREPAALAALAGRSAAAVAVEGAALADLSHTAARGRAHLPHRAALIVRSRDELRGGLEALAAGREGVRTAHVARRDPPRVAFLFTGQGAQYAGMARGLYAAAPAFRRALDRCAAGLAPHLPRPLLEVLFAEEQPSALDRTEYTQPALFAVEVALAELWRAFGVAPAAVMGHSVGELAAAHVAGVLELDEALRLVAARGRLMGSLPAGGAMAAIFAPEAEVAEALLPHRAVLSVAAVNAPGQTVISGRAAEVEAVGKAFAARKIRVQPLTVSHAFHSPLVDPVLEAFEREARTVRYGAPRVRLVSNLTGKLAEPGQVADPGYWRRHVREAVRFGDGLGALAALQPDVVLELGPHPTLLPFAKAVLGEQGPRLVPTLRKGRDDWEQLLEAVASLHLAGAALDWRAVEEGAPGRTVDLPTYPFQRERCWFQPSAGAGAVPSAPRGRATGHPLLGTRLRVAGAEVVYELRATAEAPPVLRHHRVAGRAVMPGAALLEMLLAAAQEAAGPGPVTVEDAIIGQALQVADGEARTVQLVCGPAADGTFTAAVSSLVEAAPQGSPDEPWVRHVTARLRGGAAAGEGATPEAARARCPTPVDPAGLHATLAGRGVELGPPFRVVKRCAVGEGEAFGELELAPEDALDAGAYRLHPLLLDGCLQLLTPLLAAGDGDLFLPVGLARLAFHRSPGARCTCHAVLGPAGRASRRADLRLHDAGGALVAELQGLALQRVSRDALDGARVGARLLAQHGYEPVWRTAPLPAPGPAPAALAATAERALDGLCAQAGLAAYDQLLPRLEAACADLTARALRRLGWNPAPGDEVRPAPLAERLGVAPRHRRLFARLLAILGEAGWLTRAGDGWVVARPLPDADALAVLAALRQAHPAAAELELTARTGAELCEALRGERDPLQLLFPGGSLETTERLYRDSPTARIFNGLQAEVLAAAAAAASDARPLRILEVGAGTGGTTAHLLPRLRGRAVEYTFTDVGPLFVEQARQRWGKEHPWLRFEVLDLEQAPDPARFPPGGFDVVVASNVVHATADLRATLSRLHGLLAPGGLLALLEVTAPQRWFDLTVGLTEGWWGFRDTDLRPDYPTLPRERWLGLLGEAGFEGAAALPAAPRGGVLGLQSLLLSRRSGPAPRHLLLVSDSGGVAAGLAERLRARGDRVTVLQERAVPDLAAARAVAGPVDGVVHASALDGDPWLEADAAAVSAAEAAGPAGALRAARALLGESPPPRLWLLSRAAQQVLAGEAVAPLQAEVWGVARTLRLEHPELRCTAIDLPVDAGPAELDALGRELAEGGEEPEVALRGGARHVARLARLGLGAAEARAAPSPGPWRLVAASPSLDALQRVPAARRAPGPGEVEIEVEATGLNFKDVLNVLGMYPGDPGPLGGECAGRIAAVGAGVEGFTIGDEVLAVAGGSFASHVVAAAHLVARRPEGVGAEEGASFPIAYVTAEFCLGHVARLRAGERVLVHAAAGGVGMAAVRLALRAGATVFATAGAPWKRELLRELGVQHVLDSRSTAFGDEILARTGGAGVDVVLNSLSGEAIPASFRAIARGGRFVELGKRGILTPAAVAALGKDLAYTVVDWGETAARDPALVGGILARLVAALGAGTLAPLPRHAFPVAEAQRAFRLMAQARHAGKVVVRHGAGAAPAIRRDGTYLVTGGTAGLGLVAGRWLAERGAGRIVLVGRRGETPEVAAAAAAMRAKGAAVQVEALDVADEAALAALLRRLRADGPPLRGVFHGAGVLDDAAVLHQDEARLARVLAPKVRGGWALDRLTRPDPLDAFVLFASVAGVLGSRGQANHAAANAFLDALARERAARGLPALSVDWGAWSEVGAAADRGLEAGLAAKGVGTITPAQGLSALEALLAAGRSQAVVAPVDWGRWLGGAPSPFLSEVVGVAPAPGGATASAGGAGGTAAGRDLRAQLAGEPPGRWRKLVEAFVHERAARALGLDPARPLDPRRPLGELGLDSLLAVELRNKLGTALGHTFPATLLFDHPTVEALTDHILEAVLGASSAPAVDAEKPSAGLVESIEDLSDEEVERQLAARAARGVRR